MPKRGQGRRDLNPGTSIELYAALWQPIDIKRQSIAAITAYVGLFLRDVTKC